MLTNANTQFLRALDQRWRDASNGAGQLQGQREKEASHPEPMENPAAPSSRPDLAPVVLGVKSFVLAVKARNPSNHNPVLIYYTALVVAVLSPSGLFLDLILSS